jgi:DNA replication protein DnaC
MSISSTQKITEHARALRLGFIAGNIADELAKYEALGTPADEQLEDLLHSEVVFRSERSKAARVKNACFPYKKYLSDLDPERMPADALRSLPGLKSLDFIAKGQNIVAYGNPGTGKTHLAIGLGIEAANAGFSVRYYSVPSLINRLKELKMQKNLLSIQKHFENTDLMILDELGYISFDREGGELLFTHLSMRTERKSTIITTNLSFDKWKNIFNDPVLTTAIVDRITHNSFALDMVGKTNRAKAAM